MFRFLDRFTNTNVRHSLYMQPEFGDFFPFFSVSARIFPTKRYMRLRRYVYKWHRCASAPRCHIYTLYIALGLMYCFATEMEERARYEVG